MARIYPYGSEITHGGDVWRAFQNYDRDYYPQEVYDYIYDCLDDQSTDDVVELDVIAWCCDMLSEFDKGKAVGFVVAPLDTPLRDRPLLDDVDFVFLIK